MTTQRRKTGPRPKGRRAVNVTLPPELVAKADAFLDAEESRRTRSDLVEQALRLLLTTAECSENEKMTTKRQPNDNQTTTKPRLI